MLARKSVKTLVPYFLAGTVICACALGEQPQKTLGNGQADYATGIYRIAKSATVKIIAAVQEQNLPVAPRTQLTVPGPTLGSGVWVDEGYIATCNHVVANLQGDSVYFEEPTAEYYSPQLSISSSGHMFRGTIVYRDAESDVAIIKSNIKITALPPVLEAVGHADIGASKISPVAEVEDIPKIGESVILAGFPLDGSSFLVQQGDFAGMKDFPSPAPSVPSQPGAPKLNKQIRFFLGLVSNPGNSGGPVLSSTGKLVGLLEGNLQSPVRDERGGGVVLGRPKLGADGQPIVGANGQVQTEPFPLMQNSGISFVVPARYVYAAVESLTSQRPRQ